MVQSCSAINCTIRRTRGFKLKFHRFPTNDELRQKWLQAIGRANFVPGLGAVICEKHFTPDDYEINVHGNRVLKKGSIPSVFHFLPYLDTRPIATITAGHPGVRQNVNIKEEPNYAEESLSSQEKSHKVEEAQKYKEDFSRSQIEERHRTISSDLDDIEDDFEQEYTTIYSKYEKMCRLCMIQASNVTYSVFNKLDEKYTIAQAIGECLYPLQVLPNDNLSNRICTKCIKSLRDFLRFRQSCITMDARQRELISLQQSYDSDEDYTDSEHSDEYLHEERLSDYEEDKENQEDFRNDNTNGQIVKRSSGDDCTFNEKRSVERTSNLTNTFVGRKYDKGEEELLKVLEGNDDVVVTKGDKTKYNQSKSSAVIRSSVSESNDEFFYDSANDGNDSVPPAYQSKNDDAYTENIIIEMVNDESPEPTSPMITLVDTSKLPITIKRVDNTSPKRKGAKRKMGNLNSFNAKRNMTMLKCENKEEIVILPSGISVARKEMYNSPLGQFRSELVKYAFNSQYLLAGGYLYEFGLIKDNTRRLHCIVNKCPGTAYQSKLSHNAFADVIVVITSHNHEIPDNLERKRHMFYHILYGKMRRDKNFNFKILYEQFCKLDPSLVDILPLRSVIKEICKQGPSPAPPSIHTFDQFYDLIENDDFHKIHFTDNRVQFYQERFKANDGAKAVVFGNQEVIESYSSSKLMYVDASFVIESNDFPYQLVTVLVWVEQSYYPILYAFVNMKSQEIYKKIFGFLYNNLAPNLRPDEIITDYEANLYYALGETYVESSIGGSVFYFTQNIYKKICALNLARELELNSNFRSIYNMLLMLPLLPVNTILDGLHNIEIQASELELQNLTDELFVHVHNEWICKVTPELFCVHRLENRINENIVAPFKKLRDLIMLARNKGVKNQAASSILITIEKLIDLERFLRETYGTPTKKSFTKDLSSSQKKIILKAWNYIESHPMININQFFLKVLGYIKCMENQLWIWGFYRYGGTSQDALIDASNFSIINDNNQEYHEQLEDDPVEDDMEAQNNVQRDEGDQIQIIEEYYIEEGGAIRKVETREPANYIEELTDEPEITDQEAVEQYSEKEETVVMQAVIDENGKFVLQDASTTASSSPQTSTKLNYVYK